MPEYLLRASAYQNELMCYPDTLTSFMFQIDSEISRQSRRVFRGHKDLLIIQKALDNISLFL